MKVLLDTCVLSEIHKPKGNPSVKETVNRLHHKDIFV